MAVCVCVWEGAIILHLSIFFGEVNEEERKRFLDKYTPQGLGLGLGFGVCPLLHHGTSSWLFGALPLRHMSRHPRRLRHGLRDATLETTRASEHVRNCFLLDGY